MLGWREGPLLPPYLIGKSKRPPVNGHRLFCLEVLVNLNSLFGVNVLSLHHIPGKKINEWLSKVISLCATGLEIFF